MIAFPVLIDIFIFHLLAGQRLCTAEGLENGTGVFPSAAEIVNLSAAGRFNESLDEGRNIMGMNIIPNLLAEIAENPVQTLGDIDLDEVAEKTVQFHSGVMGAGQTSTPEAAGLQTEVAPVFLHHDVSRNLRSPEDRMLAPIDAEILPDTVVVLLPGVFPAGFQLLQRQLVGRVPIDLVRGHVDKGGIGRRTPGGLQEIERPDGIDVEIIKGATGCEIVTGLSRRMNNDIRPQFLEQTQHLGPVPDIEFMMAEIPTAFRKAPLVPAGIAPGTEEIRPHVVVHSVEFPAPCIKMTDDLGTDQTARTGYQHFHQISPPPAGRSDRHRCVMRGSSHHRKAPSIPSHPEVVALWVGLAVAYIAKTSKPLQYTDAVYCASLRIGPEMKLTRWPATLLLVGVTVVWGWTFVVVAQAISAYGVMPFLAVRFLIAALTSLLLWGRHLDRKSLITGMLIGLIPGAGYLLQTWGLRFTTATNAGLITGLFVVLAPVADRIFYGRRLRSVAWLSIGLSLIGMSLLTGRLPTELAAGDLLAFGCAMAFGLHIAVLARHTSHHDPRALSTAQMLGMALLFLFLWPATAELSPPPPEIYFALFLTGVVASTLAYAIQTAAQQVLSTVQTALILTLEPVFAGFFGIWLAGERLNLLQSMGALLIIGAVLLAEILPQSTTDRLREAED